MAVVKPFRGLVYNLAKVRDLSSVVAPPYDVISKDSQEYFYDASPYNIIRLILGKEYKKDDSKFNKYKRAKKFLDAWTKFGILIKKKKPAIYIYRQTYLHNGIKRTRIGFIALMKIEDPQKSGILPHEYTLDKPKKDRFNLIKEVRANLSPIFSLYNDKNRTISKHLIKFIKKNTPFVSINLEGVNHQLWRLEDRGAISTVIKNMSKKKIFIADGHHRYEVALMYKKMLEKRKSSDKAADYVMMYFTNIQESGNVTILSTHRLLKDIGDRDKKSIIARLRDSCEITLFKDLDKLLSALAKNKMRPHFGMYLGGNTFYLLTLKKQISIQKVIRSAKSSQWKRLDVTILHDYIIKTLLSLKDSEDNIKYVREPEHVKSLVDRGKYKIAFFLNPTRVHQVKEVAEKGDMMPQKSTYFYPKLLSGLVINKF